MYSLVALLCQLFNPFFYEGNRWSSFFNIIHFLIFRLLFFVKNFILDDLPFFSNSGPIKLIDISSSLFTPELDQTPIRAAKIQSAYRRRSSTLYQKRHAQGLVITLGHNGYCTGSTYPTEYR